MKLMYRASINFLRVSFERDKGELMKISQLNEIA